MVPHNWLAYDVYTHVCLHLVMTHDSFHDSSWLITSQLIVTHDSLAYGQETHVCLHHIMTHDSFHNSSWRISFVTHYVKTHHDSWLIGRWRVDTCVYISYWRITHFATHHDALHVGRWRVHTRVSTTHHGSWLISQLIVTHYVTTHRDLWLIGIWRVETRVSTSHTDVLLISQLIITRITHWQVTSTHTCVYNLPWLMTDFTTIVTHYVTTHLQLSTHFVCATWLIGLWRVDSCESTTHNDLILLSQLFVTHYVTTHYSIRVCDLTHWHLTCRHTWVYNSQWLNPPFTALRDWLRHHPLLISCVWLDSLAFHV